MAAAVARLETADGGPWLTWREDRHPRGTERGAETLSETGQGKHGEEQDKQRGKADQILDSTACIQGSKRFHGVFHGVLCTCCHIVLISATACKELFKNISEQSTMFSYPTPISRIARS
jgi:hypothetical protein